MSRIGVPTLAVGASAAVLALGLGGHGLLVPAGPAPTSVRVAGALVAVAATVGLVRLDGPLRAGRTLLLVAVTGALTVLATLPASPVTIDAGDVPEASAPAGVDPQRTILLEQLQPGEAQDGTLVLPPGASVGRDGRDIVVHAPGGRSTVLAPGQRVAQPDGTVVVVGPGGRIEVPEPRPGEAELVPDRLAAGVEAVLVLLLGGFALLAFAPPLVRVAERSLTPVAPDPAPAPTGPPSRSVEQGLADVLRAMLADPDPRTAVIGAYARLLAALDEAGFPRRAEEAPHEHLWRSLGPLGVRRPPVHRLAELFVRARFTPHPVTDEHRRAAIAALADAVADLRLPDRDVELASTVVGPR
jgi:hypothetical protein